MAQTCRLKLSIETVSRHSRDEIHVIDFETGTPIPFTWVDAETLEVESAFEQRASVQIRPLPSTQRTGRSG